MIRDRYEVTEDIKGEDGTVVLAKGAIVEGIAEERAVGTHDVFAWCRWEGQPKDLALPLSSLRMIGRADP